MDELEKIVYNKGERLIPGITHNDSEVNRHSASYSFFWDLIMQDIVEHDVSDITVVDLGCGVGWGCDLLCALPNSTVIGMDNSIETIEYARKHFPVKNVTYQVVDLTKFIPTMPEYPYVVSRGVFEHIANGLELISQVKFGRMFIFDVPYAEAPFNKHHLLTNLTESHFKNLSKVEFLYEDIDGVITRQIAKKPNMLMCVCRR